jgi:hypothetical protein
MRRRTCQARQRRDDHGPALAARVQQRGDLVEFVLAASEPCLYSGQLRQCHRLALIGRGLLQRRQLSLPRPGPAAPAQALAPHRPVHQGSHRGSQLARQRLTCSRDDSQ